MIDAKWEIRLCEDRVYDEWIKNKCLNILVNSVKYIHEYPQTFSIFHSSLENQEHVLIKENISFI